MQPTKNYPNKIIIIGAGATALMAAKQLSPHHQVTILEARSKPGGRIRTIGTKGFTRPIEQGAEFVHGKLPISLALLKEAGIPYSEVAGNVFQVSNGQLKEQNEMIEGWDELLKQMSKVEEDLTMASFLDANYGDEKYAKLRARVKNYVQGFDVADVNNVSVKSLYSEWVNEDEENYRPDNGYDQLIAYMATECQNQGSTIHLNTIVKKVEWQKGQVTIRTEDGKIYNSDQLIITVPVSVLQNSNTRSSITFTPAIDHYIQAAANIGFGNVVKVVLQFKTAFWQNDHKDAGFILSEETIPTWWTQLPDKTPILTGWLGGPPADAMNNQSDEFILSTAIQSLSNIFSIDPSTLKSMLENHLIANWANDEWAMGAYSYATPATVKAKEQLNIPVQNTLFFAGEALYSGKSPGTVEAAFNNGQSVAQKIFGAGGLSK